MAATMRRQIAEKMIEMRLMDGCSAAVSGGVPDAMPEDADAALTVRSDNMRSRLPA
jgi:hypothetical protein